MGDVVGFRFPGWARSREEGFEVCGFTAEERATFAICGALFYFDRGTWPRASWVRTMKDRTRETSAAGGPGQTATARS